jgi:hypothetical protein
MGLVKTLSFLMLFAYLACIFGHGLGCAISIAFSDHGHHLDITQSTQGNLQVTLVHEPEVQHSGWHFHDEENPVSNAHHHHDVILCENDAVAIQTSGDQGQSSSLKWLWVTHVVIPVPVVAIANRSGFAFSVVCEANLRRLNSVVLRV